MQQILETIYNILKKIDHVNSGNGFIIYEKENDYTCSSLEIIWWKLREEYADKRESLNTRYTCEQLAVNRKFFIDLPTNYLIGL